MIEALTGGARTTQWSSTFAALLGGSRGEVLVVDEAGTLLGVVTVSYNLAIHYAGEYAQLEELIVDPAARGKNIGGLLVEAIVQRAHAWVGRIRALPAGVNRNKSSVLRETRLRARRFRDAAAPLDTRMTAGMRRPTDWREHML